MARRAKLHTNEAVWKKKTKKTLHPVIAGFDPFKLLVDIVMNSVSFVAEMKVMSTVRDVSGHFPTVRKQRKFWPWVAFIFFFFFPFLQFF